MPQVMPITPYTGNLLELQRKQALAQMLQGKALQPLQSETAGGYVVPTSPLLGVAQMLKSYMAGKMNQNIGQQYGDLYGKMSDQMGGLNPYEGGLDPNSFTQVLQGGQPAQLPGDPRAADLWKKGMAYEMMGQTDAAKAAFAAANQFASPTPEMKNYQWQGIQPQDVAEATKRELAGKGKTQQEQLIDALTATKDPLAVQAYSGTLGLVPTAEQQIQNANEAERLRLQRQQQYYETGLGGPEISGNAVTPKNESSQSSSTNIPIPKGMTPKDEAAYKARIIAERPTATTSYGNAVNGLIRLKSLAKEIMDDPALPRITGAVGALPNIPGSAASDLAAKLDSLKSQTAFSVLQNMREGSKTGGALGQVSNFEEQMLQNNLAALNTKQSPESFKKNLQKVIDYVDAAQGRLGDAYKMTYGETPKIEQPDATGGWSLVK